MGWLKAIWGIVRAGWHTLAAAGTLVGILYLGQDVTGLPTVFPWLEGVMPSREILLIAFGVACVGYIGWMDFRPFALRRLSRVSEAIAPREMSFIFGKGDDVALSRERWSTLAPRVRLKNTTSGAWNVRVGHWVYLIGDSTSTALDCKTRPIVSQQIMAGDEEMIRFPPMPWRNATDAREGALSFKLIFWQGRGPAQFEVDVLYNFKLDKYGPELGREPTQIVEDFTQQRSATYARHVPAIDKPESTAPPLIEADNGS